MAQPREYLFAITNVAAMEKFTRLWDKQFRNLFVTQPAVDEGARRGVEIMRDMVEQEGRGMAWPNEFRTVQDPQGEYYLIPVRARRGPEGHTSSAPYDPPASYTGTLLEGIGWLRLPGKAPEAAAYVYVQDDPLKLASLEFGAPKHHGKDPEGLAPRPFIRPTIEQLRKELPPLYRTIVGQEVARRAVKMRQWARSLFRKKK